MIKKIELLNKNHQNQIKVEISKAKLLQVELNHLKESNDKLLSKVEKLKYQSYGGRQSYVIGLNQSIVPQSRSVNFYIIDFYLINVLYLSFMVHLIRSTVLPKNSLLVEVVGTVVDRAVSPRISARTVKPELVHGESEISDHTKDLQKNLMRQIHEDVINKPNMLVNDKMGLSNPFGDASHLNNEISELMKVLLFLYNRFSILYFICKDNIYFRKKIYQTDVTKVLCSR